LILSLLITGVAYAQDGNPQDGTNGSIQVTVLLAPLVAAATAVERLIEMIFDWYESTILDLSKFPAQASDYLGWARKEVEKYKNELIKPLQEGENEFQLAARLRSAEENLLKAQDRLREYLSSPTYNSQKKKISVLLGIVLGLVIAFSARIQMFSLLGIPIPQELSMVDIIITGLVIGTGSAPVHSLIGIIQNTKNAVDGARALWQGKATADVQQVLLEMQAASQAAPMAAPAPLAGIPGAPEIPQAAAAPEMSQTEMNRMVKRILR
jgi:hypothetical protein